MPGDGEQELGWLCGWVWGQGTEDETHSLSLLPFAPALQMEQDLDTGVLGQLVGPGGFILSTGRNPSGSLLTSKGRAILCILGALVGKRNDKGLG